MKVGDIIIDSDGNEVLIPSDSAGYYLIQDAKVMVNVLNEKSENSRWKKNESDTD